MAEKPCIDGRAGTIVKFTLKRTIVKFMEGIKISLLNIE